MMKQDSLDTDITEEEDASNRSLSVSIYILHGPSRFRSLFFR